MTGAPGPSSGRPAATTPYVDALARYVERGIIPFHTPAHKQGRGGHPRLVQIVGARALRADLSDVAEAPDFENDFTAVLREAERLAACTFGAGRTFFLANGTTSGIHAALWAICRPGDRVLVARDAHRSVFGGLALVDARPVYLPVETDPEWGIPLGVDVDKLGDALRRHPDVRAVVVTSPNYYGAATDLEAVSAVVHAHGVPLVVDQAHGPHFRFHPALPPAAQESGADIVADSTHKWLGALTQASMLHVIGTGAGGTGDLAVEVERAVELLQTTSPSPLLFASLDASRAQMEDCGFRLIERTLELAALARSRIERIPGLRLLSDDHVAEATGGSPAGLGAENRVKRVKSSHRLDPTKLFIRVGDAGWSGPDLDRTLRRTYGVQVELHGADHVLALVTIGDTDETVDALVTALARAGHRSRRTVAGRPPGGPDAHPVWNDGPYEPELSPRAAVRAASTFVPRAASAGRVAAETITPYPPGIPLWTAGERIAPAALARLDELVRLRGVIRGASDPSLDRLRVVT